jgi:hypothetical protein
VVAGVRGPRRGAGWLFAAAGPPGPTVRCRGGTVSFLSPEQSEGRIDVGPGDGALLAEGWGEAGDRRPPAAAGRGARPRPSTCPRTWI